jgi:hypothetical protein
VNADLFDRPSTEDTGDRNALDYYETPEWMTASLLYHQPIARSCAVFEPCAGDGSIARALGVAGFGRVLTNDVNVDHPTDFHANAALLDIWSESAVASVDWVITNPPFSDAFAILEQSVLVARIGVAFLLRKTFIEPTLHRGGWLAKHPPVRVIGLPRHRFRGKGQDSCSVDWHIWEQPPRRDLAPIVIDHLAKRRRIACLAA